MLALAHEKVARTKSFFLIQFAHAARPQYTSCVIVKTQHKQQPNGKPICSSLAAVPREWPSHRCYPCIPQCDSVHVSVHQQSGENPFRSSRAMKSMYDFLQSNDCTCCGWLSLSFTSAHRPICTHTSTKWRQRRPHNEQFCQVSFPP